MTSEAAQMMQTFPAAVVAELRREGQRKGLRIRDLEEALIAKAVEAEAARAGIAPALVKDIPTIGLTVDAAGVVIGAAEAVRRFIANR